MRHDAMNKYKRLLSNTVILAVGTFSSKVLVYLLLPLYTAILSPAEYSDANIISQLANLLMPIAAVGVCDGLFRFALDAGEKSARCFPRACRYCFSEHCFSLHSRPSFLR